MSNTAIYMVTHGSVEATTNNIRLLRKVGGIDFDLYVVDSGSGPDMQRALNSMQADGAINWLLLSDDNIGQNLGANAALDAIYEHGNYDWVIAWSPDVEPKGRRSLRKLVRAAEAFRVAGAKVVVLPRVQSGECANQLTDTGDDIGVPYHMVEAAKGYVRVHPYEFLRTYRFVPFGALAFGESLEVADLAAQDGYAFVVVENVRARHLGAEAGMVERHFGYGL